MVNIKGISLAITTHCNLSCTNCTWGIQKIPMNKREHYTWEYLENCAKYFKGIETIYITGGEPTLHPNLEEWSYRFKQLFKCKNLYIWTNGLGFNNLSVDAFNQYDRIIITLYDKNTYKGSVDNSEQIMDFIESFPTNSRHKIQPGRIDHLINIPGGPNPCGRQVEHEGLVPYLNGKVYHCCGGIAIQKGVILSDSWRTDILNEPLNCDLCVFGEF